MKIKVLSVILAMVLVLPVFSSYGEYEAESETGELYAARVGFDNNDVSGLITNTPYMLGDLNGDKNITPPDSLFMKRVVSGVLALNSDDIPSADINNDGNITSIDAALIVKHLSGVQLISPVQAANAKVSYNSTRCYANITGNNDYSVRIEASSLDISSDYVSCVVLNTTKLVGVTVTPITGANKVGNIEDSSSYTEYNSTGYFKFEPIPSEKFGGVIVSFDKDIVSSAQISEVFFCTDEYSAKWICDNRITSPVTKQKTLKVSLEDEKIAVRLEGMTADDRNHTNGGFYHDYVNTKWPSVAVDENDKVYVVGSGSRSAHVDTYGAALMVTSTDGGKTYSYPRYVTNTLMDDRDAGICYLGQGKLLVSWFTNELTSYLPGGSNYWSLVLRDYGGGSASWQAASWDSNGNPIGGINGSMLELIEYAENDPFYDGRYASYVVQSNDYGETWNNRKYSIPNGSGLSTSAKKMMKDFEFDYPATEVPVTASHGPVLISDGSCLFVGKVLNIKDRPRDTMAVYVSHDDGYSWDYRSYIETPYGYYNNNFHELSVTETKDGALLCAIRTQQYDDKYVTPGPTVYTCFSYDKGRTWTLPSPTGVDGSPPHVITMPNGDIVMTVSYRGEPKAIYAYVSTDGGRTWSTEATVSGRFPTGDDMGYPANAVLSDGTIVTVYYGSYCYQNYADQYSSIKSMRWTYTLK